MFRIVVTEPAEQDIQLAYCWWRDHRSPAQAEEWFEKILSEMQSLSTMPERCARAPESRQCGRDIRQLLFGTGQKKTHRVVYLFEGSTVKVLRVRHVAQDILSTDALRKR